jgi:hypothetical protein
VAGELDDTGVLGAGGASGDLGGLVPDPGQTGQSTPTTGGDPTNPLVAIPLTEDQIAAWFDWVTRSRARREQVSTEWDILMKEYLPVVSEGAEDVKAGIHFRNVHTKIAKTFFKNPDLILTPEGPLKDKVIDPMTMMPQDSQAAASVFQAVLRAKLGRKGVNAKKLMSDVLFDVFAWSGVGCIKSGYRNVIKQYEEPVTQPDPNWQPPPPMPGSILGLGGGSTPPQVPVQVPDPMIPGAMKALTRTVPVVIWEQWYMDRFSPKKLLLADDLNSTDFDKDSSAMGMEFFMPLNTFKSTFKVPDDVEVPTATEVDNLVYQHDSHKSIERGQLVHGVEIYYKTAIHDDSGEVFHPEAMRQLVLVENDKSRVYVHRDSPDQTFDARGKLTPDSMIGFPYSIVTNRPLADTPWVKADTAFTNSSAKHINTHRKQSVAMRDANIGKYLFDPSAFTPEEVQRIKDGKVGEWIACQPGKLAQGKDKLIAELAKINGGRDDWRLSDQLKRDVEETLGISGPTSGGMTDEVRSATEIATSSGALAERIEDEQGYILNAYLEAVEKFATLILRYATDEDYVEIVGSNGDRILTRWDKHVIAGKWAYTAKPNSQLRVDAAKDRAQKIEYLKELAPFVGTVVNPVPLIRDITIDFGIDPNEVIISGPPIPVGPGAPGQPPPPGAPAVPPGPGGPPPGMAPHPPTPGVAPTGGLPNAPTAGAGTTQVQNMIGRG